MNDGAATAWKTTPDATDPKTSASDIYFGLQFDNPVAGKTPVKDGVFTAVRQKITYTAGSATNPTGLLEWNPDVLFDLKPASDYDLATYDKSSTCDTVTPAYTQTNAGDWS